jgi:hypothetical protein
MASASRLQHRPPPRGRSERTAPAAFRLPPQSAEGFLGHQPMSSKTRLGPTAQPLSQAPSLQHGGKALHWRRCTLLCRLYRAISRCSYNRLSALQPVLGLARPLLLRRSKELVHCQRLHDLPPNDRLLASRARPNSVHYHGHLMARLMHQRPRPRAARGIAERKTDR